MLGDNMKELRLSHKYTQDEVAKMLKISKSTIGMYEQNRRTPDLETLTQFADIFNVSIDTLLGRNISLSTPFNISWEKFTKYFPNALQVNDEEKDIILYYRNLSNFDKRWIMGLMIDLIKKQEESDIAPKKAQ